MNINSRTSKVNFTGYASGSIASFTGLRAAPIKVAAQIVPIQSGSGDPAPDNIRPIIGASECNVVRCGKNVWDEEWEVGSIDPANGNPSVANNVIRSKNFIPVKGSSTCYLTNLNIYAIFQYDEDYNFLQYNQVTTNTFSFGSDVKYIKFRTKAAYGTTYNNDISINYPATDTDYHAYTGNTYTIQLGDTYYGGELDVTNGVLRVDKGYKLFDGSDDENWTFTGTRFVAPTNDMVVQASRTEVISNIGKYDASSTSDGTIFGYNGSVYYYLSTQSTLADFKLWLASNNMQLVYPLATPITVQLTPTQIEQLLGANNVFADTGDVKVFYVTV